MSFPTAGGVGGTLLDWDGDERLLVRPWRSVGVKAAVDAAAEAETEAALVLPASPPTWNMEDGGT